MCYIKVNKRKASSGNSVLTLPFVIVISLTLIIIFGFFTINMILPFIWYEKLQHMSYKYMYVIEKYGYLTSSERASLIEELEEHGFDKNEIKIESPIEPAGYGNVIKFNIRYNYKQKLPSWKGSFKMVTRIIPLNVNKTIISKI